MKVAIASALLFAATALAAALPEPAPAAVPADMPPPDYWQTVKYPANNKLDDWVSESPLISIHKTVNSPANVHAFSR